MKAYSMSYTVILTARHAVTAKLARSYDVNYGVRSVLNEVKKIAVQIVAEAHIRGDLKDG